jgi:peptidoglycan L-alanyl-D-glutamate endopeptidase CwlK
MMLSAKSKAELAGVHPDLVRVVKRALELTTVDFAVHDGKRTVEEQRKLVLAGASQTMQSRHLTGHAVDLVPVINGKLRWEWPPIYVIALAVKQAAVELSIPIRWGGCWSRLNALDEPLEDRVSEYVTARKALGKSAFLDGPHMELPIDLYPVGA